MSSGARAPDHAAAVSEELEEQLAALVRDKKFAASVQRYRNTDSSHDVAYLAGNQEDGKGVDFDKDFAQAIERGEVKLGDETIDPRPFIHAHEAIEGSILREQFDPKIWGLSISPEDAAHPIAIIAERRLVERAFGEKAWRPYLKATAPWIKEDTPKEVPDPPPGIMREGDEGSTDETKDDKVQQSDRAAGDGRPGEKAADEGRAMYGGYGGSMGGHSQYGARLTTKARKKLPAGKFLIPERRAYPDDTAGRARNALSRVSQFGSPEEKARVRAGVRRDYPSIKQSGARKRQYGDAMDFSSPMSAAMSGLKMGLSAKPQQRQPSTPPVGASSVQMPQGSINDLPQSGARYGASPSVALHRIGSTRGARHGDEVQDRALIKRMLAQHEREEGEQKGARGLDRPPRVGMPKRGAGHYMGTMPTSPGEEGGGGQGGARMPPHMHALTMASATHLHRMGHLSKPQLAAIHAHAKSNMKGGGMAGGMPGMAAAPSVPSFGSLAPPEQF